MPLRCTAPKTGPKLSVPPRSPTHKPRSLSTPSESTLPQLLIPLGFNSFISNAYKKPGGGSRLPSPKFRNSSLPAAHRSCTRRNPRNPIPLIRLLHNFRTPPGAGISSVGQPNSLPSRGFRVMNPGWSIRPSMRLVFRRPFCPYVVTSPHQPRPAPATHYSLFTTHFPTLTSVCPATPLVLVSALRNLAWLRATQAPASLTFSPYRYSPEPPKAEDSLRRNQTDRSGYSTFGSLGARPLKGTG